MKYVVALKNSTVVSCKYDLRSDAETHAKRLNQAVAARSENDPCRKRIYVVLEVED